MLCVGFMYSQEQYGNLRGIVVDTEGEALPGVKVTLETEEYGSRSMTTTTGGIFRFLNITPSLYTLRCELAGLKTYIQQNLDIRVGINFDLEIIMEPATLQEEVTIVAESPIVDTKKVGTAMNVTLTELQDIPSARDPWVILQRAAGIFVAQENVGGSHSAGQSWFYSKGVAGGAHMYNMDGVSITEIIAIPNNMWLASTSSRYYDFDSFGEIQLVTSGADASIQSSGVSINMVTRRGGNKYEAMTRFFFTNDDLQGDNRTQELIDLEYVGNRIVQITDYGLQVGGPIKRDKLWFWLGGGIQDIRRLTIDGFPENYRIDSINSKINFQINHNNRAELAFLFNNKTVFNQNAGPRNPPETTWNQSDNGFPFLKLEDEHMFSENFIATLKLAGNIVPARSEFEPVGGTDVQMGYDIATGVYSHTTYQRWYSTPNYSGRVDGNYFVEGLLGGEHEFKFGVEYRYDQLRAKITYPNDALKFYRSGSPIYARVYRPSDARVQANRLSFYFNDSYSRGRFTLNFGIRYDHEKSVNQESSVPASLTAPDILPAINYPAIDPGVSLNTISPRFGLTYALTGDRKTILRSNLARYGLQNGTGVAGLVNPAALGNALYFWNDKNSDDWVSTDELIGYPTKGILAYANCDPWNPTRVDDPDAISPDLKSIVTDEFLVGIEREIFTDISLSATLILRRTHQERWDPYYDEETAWKEGQENWLGPIQKSLEYDGVTYNYEYWTLDRYRPAGVILETAPDRHVNYTGIEFTAIKRLSHRWMMNLSFTYQKSTGYLGEKGFLDPTNVDKWEGQPRDYDSRWLAKLSFLYQLPWGFSFSGFANAREGTVFLKRILAATPERAAVGLGTTQNISIEPYGTTRLSNFYNCDLSLAKDFLLGKYGRLTLQVDAFNVFNFNHTLQRFSQVNSPRYREIENILNPRVIRFGVRYRY